MWTPRAARTGTYFEVIPSGSGAVARGATVGALPGWVEAMGCAAYFAPTAEDLGQIARLLAERSQERVLKGFKVV